MSKVNIVYTLENSRMKDRYGERKRKVEIIEALMWTVTSCKMNL